MRPINIRQYINPLAAIASSLILVACSSSSDSDSDSDNGSIENQSVLTLLDGTWTRNCVALPDGTFSFRDTVIIDGDTTERIRENFNDTDCQLAISETSFDASVTFGEPGVIAESGLTSQQVDSLIGETRITPLSDATTLQLNSEEFCGVSDYSTGTEQAIAIECFPTLGEGMLFELWAVDGDMLFFGLEQALTVEERATTLDVARPFFRQ